MVWHITVNSEIVEVGLLQQIQKIGDTMAHALLFVISEVVDFYADNSFYGAAVAFAFLYLVFEGVYD